MEESPVKSLQTHRRDAVNAEFRGGYLLSFSAKLRALCASAVKLTFLPWTLGMHSITNRGGEQLF